MAKEIQDTWKPQRGDLVGRQVVHRFVGDELKAMGGFSYDCIILTVYGDCPADSLTSRADEEIKYKPILAYYTRNPMGWSSLATMLDDHENGLWFYEFYKEDLRWLPKQDQLQARINLSELSFSYQVQKFEEFVKAHLPIKYNSWEIAWLSFLMYSEYNKIWDGKDWVMK